MVSVLKQRKKALSLNEVVEVITKTNPDVFTGKTPRNPLYSIIYRKEKSRIEKGEEPLFIKEEARNSVLYLLNPKRSSNK